MKEKMMYLRPNVVIEPLIDQWYAWSHLLSPATSAMNIVGRHLRIMDSFIQAPAVHEAAVKNPKLRGGPFMDVPPQKVEAIKALREKTVLEQESMIAFAAAIRELDRLLKTKADGHSLQPLYPCIPPLLKGYVELFYDLNNNPSFRLFEKLLYKSPYYDTRRQSIALWVTNNDERPFVLSTPRLPSEEVLHLPLSFNDPLIDRLSAMKRRPDDVSAIKAALSFSGEAEEALFDQLFTDIPPPPYDKYTGDKARMRYFGHACILVEFNDVSILVDPLISYYGYESSIEHFSDFDLPPTIDYVLITHNHQDHILFETLLPLRHRIGTVVVPKTAANSLQDPSLKDMFRNIGFRNVVEIEEMDSIEFADCTITGIPFLGEHSDLNVQSKMCHLLRIREFSILFAADSCNIEPAVYDHVQKLVGNADVLFLGMECDGAPLTWLYGPLLTEDLPREKDHSRRLAGSNYQQGIAMVHSFQPKEVYVYAMGQEPWLEFISSIKYTPESNPILESNRLIDDCENAGIVSERLFGEKEILYTV
ncbi:MAG TPA: MBL fold metallo-hydrolase [Puia sp.]|uniref:MBL fold metallo-hydrolase n=1 Tax=Puia sp. TaxID=2045100 RepID=UPI002BCE590A|nr:MBL fold metallo-hydrolase [Puia sp.]HVU94508.1 MBL fold metallo-hydrolase [Puia sp.]